MNFNFLIQATRVLNQNDIDEAELELITNFILIVDEEILYEYSSTCTLVSYDTDLDLYFEILEILLKIYEEKEEYEVCEKIKNKIDDAIIIKNNKTI